MAGRILIMGKNSEIPRDAMERSRLRSADVVLFPRRKASPHSGMTPESEAGGTRTSNAKQTVTPGACPHYPPLGVTPMDIWLLGTFAFASGFGLAWCFP